jgi:hypothetical protein
MKYLKVISITALLFVILFITFYFLGFLLGYGANSNSLGSEKKLFIAIFVAHVIISILLFKPSKKRHWKELAVSFFFGITLYFIVFLKVYDAY